MLLQEFCSEPPFFPCTLYGPTCDAFDELFPGEPRMPELDVGDRLVFPCTGAYASTMSSTFNGLLPAAVCCALEPELRCPDGESRDRALWGSHQDLHLARRIWLSSVVPDPRNTLLPQRAPAKPKVPTVAAPPGLAQGSPPGWLCSSEMCTPLGAESGCPLAPADPRSLGQAPTQLCP